MGPHRHTNQLRNALLEFYPAAVATFDELAHMDTVAVLAAAPTPDQGHALSIDDIEALLEPEPGNGSTVAGPNRSAPVCSPTNSLHPS